jgi:transcriptional regulator GlxA family with amidase domain
MYEAEDLINRRLGERFSIGDLAAEIGISHEHLIRLFRIEHGVTPLAYIRERRVESARRLLATTTICISSISSCGGASECLLAKSEVKRGVFRFR